MATGPGSPQTELPSTPIRAGPVCCSLVMPDPNPEPPSTEIPPETLAVTADLLRLTAEDRQHREDPGCHLPPLLAALTRRSEDAARLRHLPVTPEPAPHLPCQPPSSQLLPVLPPPRVPPDFVGGASLQPQPPVLGHAAGADAVPDPLGVQELYRELSRAVVLTEWRQIHRDPVIEPAAAAADLLPKTEPGPRNTGQLRHRDAAPHRERRPNSLFDDYLRYVAATGSDFLCTIFLPCRGAGEEEPSATPLLPPPPPPQIGKEPALQPAERGFWKPVLLGPAPVGMEKLQRRLHRLWAALDVPNRERLDMAVKYGSSAVTARLPAALDAWEVAAAGILRRELLLARLEQLEERGSDPTRFFRGAPASARGEEARSRGILLAALARCEARLSATLRRVADGFGDTVTFRGRPYAEKMRRDRVEMLYWLQQRRRAGAFQDVFGVQPPGTDRAGMPGGQ